MEKTTLILISLTLLFLVLIIGLLTFLIFKMFKQNQNSMHLPHQAGPQLPSALHPGILERLKEVEKIKSNRSELFCPNHPEEPGEVMCGICDHLYCKACIKPFKSLYYCKEHLPLIMNNEWEEVLTLKTSTEDPERGVKLFDVKKQIFEQDREPTYIETHYKINVDQDYIETYLVLFAIKKDIARLKNKIHDLLS
jgi:hypothetical protein